MNVYSEEIVFADSEDGWGQVGVLITPSGEPAPLTTIVWIHGGGCNFYVPTYIRIGRELAQRGYAFLSGNTRGHDMANLMFPAAYGADFGAWRDGGTMFEDFGELALDIAAWLDWVSARGAQRIILAGHSLGGAKVLVYQAERQDPRVAGLVAASPAAYGYPPEERLHLAREMVEAGKGDQPLPAPTLGRWYESARRVLSVGIVESALGVPAGEPRMAAIQCPILAFIGEHEVADEAGTLEAMQRHARSAARIDTTIIAGADHMYRNYEPAIATVIAGWAATL
jgi:pimeloyl-ACP methyl ester carboxylesterase